MGPSLARCAVFLHAGHTHDSGPDPAILVVAVVVGLVVTTTVLYWLERRS